MIAVSPHSPLLVTMIPILPRSIDDFDRSTATIALLRRSDHSVAERVVLRLRSCCGPDRGQGEAFFAFPKLTAANRNATLIESA